MIKLIKNKAVIFVAFIFGVFIFIFGINWVLYLQKAHSTFEEYYSFRGCVKLLSKTPTYGTCKTDSGQTVKIVKFRGKWYLDGDLPCGFFCF